MPMRAFACSAVFVVSLAMLPVSAAGAEAETKSAYVSDFDCTRGPWKLNIGKSLASIRALGKPTAERTEPGYGQNTEIRVLQFEGLAVRALFVKGDYRDGLVDSVEVTRPQWGVTADLKVGHPLSAVAKKAQRPVEPHNAMVKVCGDTDCATFQVSDGRISRIIYECYTG